MPSSNDGSCYPLYRAVVAVDGCRCWDVAVGMSLLVYNQHLKICLYLLPSVWMLGYELDSRQLSSATNKRLMLGRCVGALSLRWSLVMLAKQVALFDYCLINLDVSAQPQPFLLVSGRSHPLI